MLFPTFAFASFFLCVFIGFWYVFRRDRERRVFLVAASYLFYAFWDWRYLALLALSTAANFGFGLLIGGNREHAWRKFYLVLSVAFNLLILGFFKYYGFFADSANALVSAFAARAGTAPGFLLPAIRVAMPVGISFYTFKAMSYVFDIYLCKMPASRSALDVALYVSFFPQLASGPIVHAVDFFPQIERAARSGYDVEARPIEFSRASALIASGLFKKMVIANFLSTLFTDPVFQDPGACNALESLFAAISYSAVIYADFSGYSDLAIGVALLLGFSTPANFDRPYVSRSVTEFWKRWHITFSSWLRDYLYFSLGGSRFGLARTLFALVFTMILGGIWHGASLTFVVWGLMQGIALALERAFGSGNGRAAGRSASRAAGRAAGRVRATLRVAGTFLFVTVSWIVFRAPSLESVGAWFRSLSGFGKPIQHLSPLAFALTAVAIGAQFIPPAARGRAFAAWRAVPNPAKGIALGLFMAALAVVSMSGVAPFIYFSF